MNVYTIIISLMSVCKTIKPNIDNKKHINNYNQLVQDYMAITNSYYFSNIQNIYFNSHDCKCINIIMEKLEDFCSFQLLYQQPAKPAVL